MRWKTFLALLSRDVHVARRNLLTLLLQVMIQPMLFVFVFGKVMTRSGFMTDSYKALLIPGVMVLSMLMSGVQAVAMPLIAEFQFTKEIEDRLLAPIEPEWIAMAKVVSGMAQSLLSGLAVLPAAWLLLGTQTRLSLTHPAAFVATLLLIAFLSAAGGLALGSSVGQTQIGLIFSMVLAPMIFFGCVYYPWSALASFPIVQKAVLVNPLVYASEGMRAALTPQFPHISLALVMAALAALDGLLLYFGTAKFNAKALG